jgi:hypothetical protein
MDEMENKQPSMLKVAVNYGLLTGVGLIVLTLVFYLAGAVTNRWANWLSYVILIAGIVIGMKAYRDEVLGGFVGYGNALGLGVLVGVIAAVVSSLFGLMLYHVIDPGLMQQALLEAEMRILERMPDITDQQLDQALRFTRVMFRPAIMLFFSIFAMGFMSLIFSLVAAAFVKKEAPLQG